MIAKIIKVYGDVQGVFYRHHTKQVANSLGLVGWAKNEHDGTVTIFVQGKKENVEKLIEWAHRGSPMATVEKVETQDVETDESLKGFVTK